MYVLLAMAVALALLVGLMHLKVRIGLAMVISALALAVLLGVTPSAFWSAVIHEWHDKPLGQTTGYLFVTLTALVMLVNSFGTAMKETGVSQRLVPAMQGLFRSRRVAMAVIPLMMGMLPTPGGIMLSAPMVRDLGDHIGVERSRSAAINFLFRHQWETIWPLFPAVPLIQGMFGISAHTLISHNIAIMVGGIVGSVFFVLLWGIPVRRGDEPAHRRFHHNLRGFMDAFWPIAVVAALYAAFGLSPAIGILPALLVFLALHKVPLSCWGAIVKSGMEIDFALLIFGALVFKLNLEAGQAIPSVVKLFSDMNMSPYVLIFVLPMLVSFLTGLTMPTVAMTFPFLVPFIGTGQETKVGLETLAFSGLMCGLLITPVHLCLALSATYFETPLRKVILKALGPAACVAAAGALMAVLGR